MTISSIREAKKAAHFDPVKPIIIACKACRRPLFQISHKAGAILGISSYDNVGPYEDYWENQQPKKTYCPHCGESYCDAVQLPDGTWAAVPYTIDEF